MRRWILQLGPFYVPTEAREALADLHDRSSSEQYVDKIWAQRYPHPVVRKSPNDAWPLACASKNTLSKTNVIRIKK